MNVLYCVSELTDWIDVAKYFNKNKNWEPICWISTKKNHNYFKSKFPNIDTIDFFEINRGIIKSIKKTIILDKVLIQKYIKYEKIAIKMMDRMDPTGFDFNYTQRVQLYYNILEFTINYIYNNNVKLVLFNESPHSIFTYLIYCIAQENNIKILRLSPTHIYANTFLTSVLEKEQNIFYKEYQKIKQTNQISQEALKYIDTVNGKYSSATPYYMDKIISSSNQNNTIKVIKSIMKAIEYSLRRKKRLNYHKNSKNDSIRKYSTNKNFSRSIINATLYKLKLEKVYTNYVKTTLPIFDFNKKFIYVPLQYQPEKSTSPEGDIFVDQFLMINMLSKLSKLYSFKIYIKEHISQFSTKLHGEQGRIMDFYEELSHLDNIVFVNTNISSFSLIDKSLCVATITGTAGFESIIRKKPSIIFGYPWYKKCKGVFHIETYQELKNTIENILEGYTIDDQETQYFLTAIFNLSEKIYLNHSNKYCIADNEHSNTMSIIKLIEKYENEII